MNMQGTLVILFAIATVVAIVAKRIRVPYTVCLVLAGLGIGALRVFEAPHLTRELLFAVFLPGLLFDAAFHLDARHFWHNRMTIGALAVPGVLLGIVLTGLIVTAAIQGTGLYDGFTWRHGLLFGALVAATDPIAVVGLFRHLNAPARLTILVEGESLINDGTSIVALTLILAFLNGDATSGGDLLIGFITIVGGGALLGSAIGFAVSRVITHIDDPMIEITLTTIAAYGSFIAGEHLHYSGVIATVAAGMICGSYGHRVGMSPSTQLAVQTFWEYVAFALNSVIFLLIGFDVGITALAESWLVILIAFLAVLLSRAGVILGVTSLMRRTQESIPFRWAIALTWSGLRGALSMVLALGLAPDFPGRNLLLAMTFGVVIASILVQGLSMPFVLRRLGMVSRGESRFAYDVARGRVQVASAVEGEINRMRGAQAAPSELLKKFEEKYRAYGNEARESLIALNQERSELREETEEAAVEHFLRVEKAQLLERLRSGLLSRDAYDQLASEVDSRLVRLKTGDFDDPVELTPSVPDKDMPAEVSADAARSEKPALDE